MTEWTKDDRTWFILCILWSVTWYMSCNVLPMCLVRVSLKWNIVKRILNHVYIGRYMPWCTKILSQHSTQGELTKVIQQWKKHDGQGLRYFSFRQNGNPIFSQIMLQQHVNSIKGSCNIMLLLPEIGVR